jgi:hypothetical protein
MGTFLGFRCVVVTADKKVDATAQFDIENYDVEWKKALCFVYIFDSGIIQICEVLKFNKINSIAMIDFPVPYVWHH